MTVCSQAAWPRSSHHQVAPSRIPGITKTPEDASIAIITTIIIMVIFVLLVCVVALMFSH